MALRVSNGDNDPIYTYGTSTEFTKYGDINKSKMVFNFPADKNKNHIVDYQDFDCHGDANLFKERGLIGKTWDFVKSHVGKLFGIKSARINMTRISANNQYLKDSVKVDENGNVVSYTQDWVKSLYTQKYTLDEYGNPNGYDLYRIEPDTPDEEEFIEHVQINNEYDDEGNLVSADHIANGGINGITYNYNKDGTIASTIPKSQNPKRLAIPEKYDSQGRRVFEVPLRDEYGRELLDESGKIIMVNGDYMYDESAANYIHDRQISTVDDFRVKPRVLDNIDDDFFNSDDFFIP